MHIFHQGLENAKLRTTDHQPQGSSAALGVSASQHEEPFHGAGCSTSDIKFWKLSLPHSLLSDGLFPSNADNGFTLNTTFSQKMKENDTLYAFHVCHPFTCMQSYSE